MRTTEVPVAPHAIVGGNPSAEDGDLRDALLRAIALAAAPHERASLSCFSPKLGDDVNALVERREMQWIRLAAKGDRGVFTELLASRDLPLDRARSGLAPVEVTDPTTLPVWGRDVLALFATAPSSADGDVVPPFTLGDLADAHTLDQLVAEADTPWGMHAIFEPVLRRGRAHVAAVIARSPMRVGAMAERQLLATLAQRLSGVCATVFYHVVTVRDIVGEHPGMAGQSVQAVFFRGDAPVMVQWSQLFGTYPVLARLLAVAYRNWCESTAELITRLGRDYQRLEAAYGAGELGALVECAQGIGDPHDQGRTVALLAFASGTKVIYKPKDLRVVEAFMTLVDALNAHGLEPALPRRTVVSGDGYLWDEFIAEQHCTSLEEVRRFYRQIGMHARLIQLLDGTDFTGDNLIAGGEFPALIDLEAVLSPRVPLPREQSPVTRAAALDASESPVRGCLVTVKILGERGRPAAELGALAPLAECIAPFKQLMLRRTENGLALVDVYPEFPPSRANPFYMEERVRSTDHFDDVVAGYVAMGVHLRRVHSMLDDPTGPLEALRNVQVRCLCRDTHIYARMLRSSLCPARMRDSVTRELCMERMWLAHFSSNAVVRAEIDALRDLDIPMFGSLPASRALLMGGSVLADDFFEDTASARLTERIRALPATTRGDDRESIESVLFTLAPDIRRRVHVTPVACAEANGWSSSAERVGREIAASAVGTRDEPAWIGANYHPWSDSWSFSALADDLYSGTAGVGLVLAELAAHTGDARFAALAAGTLRGIGRRLGDARAEMIAEPAARPPGAMFGWGGMVYACERGAQLLSDDTLHEEPDALFAALAQSGKPNICLLLTLAGAWDAGTGAAGLLLASLANAPAGTSHRSVVASAAAFFHTGWPVSRPRDAAIYPANAYPADVVGMTIGEHLALTRWRAWSGAPAGVTPELAPATTGDVLGLLSLARDDERQRADSLRHADARLALPVGEFDGLGWVARGEIALAAHGLTDRDSTHGSIYLAAAQDAGERLLDLKARTGRWIPERLLADRYNPSAVVGLGAIAHLFLQLATPGRLRSYRTLE